MWHNEVEKFHLLIINLRQSNIQKNQVKLKKAQEYEQPRCFGLLFHYNEHNAHFLKLFYLALTYITSLSLAFAVWRQLFAGTVLAPCCYFRQMQSRPKLDDKGIKAVSGGGRGWLASFRNALQVLVAYILYFFAPTGLTKRQHGKLHCWFSFSSLSCCLFECLPAPSFSRSLAACVASRWQHNAGRHLASGNPTKCVSAPQPSPLSQFPALLLIQSHCCVFPTFSNAVDNGQVTPKRKNIPVASGKICCKMHFHLKLFYKL